MKIENLKEGMTVKNYKVLCELLDEKETGGDSKKKQLKEWYRYFEYEKEKTAFKIIKIYDRPRVATTDQHLENFLLVNLLNSRKNNENGQCVLFGTKSTYYSMLALINHKYKDYRFNPSKVNKDLDIEYENAIELCEIINNTLAYKLKSLLNKLEKKKLILKEEIYMVCVDNPATISESEKEDDIDWVEELSLNSIDNTTNNSAVIHRLATDSEKKEYMRIHGETLKEMGCSDFSELFKNKRIKNYMDRLNKNLYEQLKIKHMYKCYRIYFYDTYIEDELSKMKSQYNLTKKEIQKEMQIINETFKNKLKLNSIRRNEKAKYETRVFDGIREYIELFDEKRDRLLRRSKESYMEDVEKFITALIEINGMKVLNDMKQNILNDTENELDLFLELEEDLK